MRLRDASAFFDRTPCADAYDGSGGFNAQLNLFDDSARDGTTVLRRVLSVDDSVVIPARRALGVHGDVYIVGGDHIDSFDGEVVRRKYVCHKAQALASVCTADQAVRALAGASMYAGAIWIKDMKELETSSRMSSFYDLYVASSEAVATGAFVSLSGRWYLVRNAYLSAAGFNVLEADQLAADCAGVATYQTKGAYNPSTDTVASTPSTVPIIVHRWQDEYFYHRMTSSKFEVGDVIARVSKTSVATALPGDSFTVAGAHYVVVSARDDGAGCWSLHAQRD